MSLIDDMPLETILRQFGIDINTLEQSDSLRNYYRSS